jgi:hypothetical protein
VALPRTFMRDISRRAIRRARVLPKSAFLGLGHQLDCGLWRYLGREIGVCSGVDGASFRAGVNLLFLDGGVTITYPFFMLTFCKIQQNLNHVNMMDLFKLTSTEQSRVKFQGGHQRRFDNDTLFSIS